MIVCDSCGCEITGPINLVPVCDRSYPANVKIAVIDAFGDILSPGERDQTLCVECTKEKIMRMLMDMPA